MTDAVRVLATNAHHDDDATRVNGVGGVFLAVTLIPAVGMAVVLVLLGLALAHDAPAPKARGPVAESRAAEAAEARPTGG